MARKKTSFSSQSTFHFSCPFSISLFFLVILVVVTLNLPFENSNRALVFEPRHCC
ncbi:hypothetical protein K450DRAFT_242406 [Umbelopsis ramanniana AG]|uniref:Transmembrane protein n=1 Tax=Umbelopsis ramanniana AG TaxID=1314678 RepID=A0AAD5HCN6_UMBRA|nr:uncharacterized protein K450DRAFT_242406 [Umbelopsis ramanniana AG]KAI8579257.1 hypothetical protein K450DRAFT_242406 [Umbelopsis ramanniana AG]